MRADETTKHERGRLKVSRRKALAGLGVGITSLSGCLDDSGSPEETDDSTGSTDSSETTYTLYTAPQETTNFAISQAIAGTVNPNSEGISIDALPSEGTIQSMSYLNQGDADFAVTDLRNAYNIINEEGDYADNPFDVELRQCFHYVNFQTTFATNRDSDIQSVADFAGERIGWGIEAGALPENLRAHLESAVSLDEIDGVPLGYGEEPSALNEGRVQAVTEVRAARDIVPSYDQEQHSMNDQRLVDWPEEAVNQIQQTDPLTGTYYSSDDLAASEEAGWGDAETRWWADTIYPFFTTAEMSEDHVYEVMNTLYQNTDQLANSHPVTELWTESEFEFWTNDLPEWIPLHEGAKRFYDEIGIDY